MLYGCGLRVTELVDLQISNLRFNEGYLIVTGKGNKQRIVPINHTAIKFVRIYKRPSAGTFSSKTWPRRRAFLKPKRRKTYAGDDFYHHKKPYD